MVSEQGQLELHKTIGLVHVVIQEEQVLVHHMQFNTLGPIIEKSLQIQVPSQKTGLCHHLHDDDDDDDCCCLTDFVVNKEKLIKHQSRSNSLLIEVMTFLFYLFAQSQCILSDLVALYDHRSKLFEEFHRWIKGKL